MRNSPGHLVVFGVDSAIKFIVDFLFAFDRSLIVFDHHFKAAENIPDLAFREKNDAAVHHDIRIGTITGKKIGKPWNRHAEIGTGISVPVVMKIESVLTNDLHWPQELVREKTSRVDEHVCIVLFAVFSFYACGVDLHDAIG